MEFSDLKSQYKALKRNVDARIHTVLEHGAYIMGPEVDELERRLAAFTGARHCITVASGTDALLIALMAVGIRPGDEVITTGFSFIATAEVIVLLGAKPVFVDIEADTCNIDTTQIEDKITSRTRAIMPVSLYGQPADMDEINAIAARHGLAVIEDGAQSFGALYRGRRSGNLSLIGCTSFFPSKPLGCYGDGGAIFTSDDTLAQTMREIRVHGQAERYRHTRLGIGGRMDTLQCAVVLAKMDCFEMELRARICAGELYNELFSGRIGHVAQRRDRTGVYGQYTVMLDRREDVRRYLAELGIPSAVHYPHTIPAQPAYREYAIAMALPVAEMRAEQVMSLPLGAYMRDEDIVRVAEAVKQGALS